MKGSEIRKKFLKFFEKSGHSVVHSSSLVPKDPTVLLTLAGMLQFKPVFLGEEKPSFSRATSAQKCMRMIDIENVGRTPRHHTFFEMLGNFSFGDYFKKDAISFAWAFLTEEMKLDKGRLSIAVFEKDDEAYDIWAKEIGLPEDRIFRLGEDNNFWSVGPTGPCGPCSEIYWDMGEKHGCGRPSCAPGCDCDRFLELWNLVFIEFNRDNSGKLLPLPSKGIDTGMGLERIASVLQNVDSNFKTDLFKPIIDGIRRISKKDDAMALHVVADHIRAAAFLIGDGVLPGNEGRGYVLRRLIRRAVRFGARLGVSGPFLDRLSQAVIKQYGDAYPELKKESKNIQRVIRSEEESFEATLDQGLKLLEQIIGEHAGDKVIPGDKAFRLHDTFGFPLDLTREIASESGFSVDSAGFEREMKAQRERAREAGIGKKHDSLDPGKYSGIPATKFVGYDDLQTDARVLAVFPDEGIVILDRTAFYPEGGGQAGDAGTLTIGKEEVKVLDTRMGSGGVILHSVKQAGKVKPKSTVSATVDAGRRFSTARHHTSTHLLHRALRDVLGEDTRQTGSFVGPEHFRFDYTHSGALSEDEISEISSKVNSKIREAIDVETFEASLDEAQKMGAVALFGEKYGERVRVLKIGDYSMELCGGTHVRNTGVIELFRILSDSSVASGVRRIEAVSGSKVIEHILSELEDIRRENVDLICACKAEEFRKQQLGGAPLLDFDVFEITIEEVNTIKKALRNKDLGAVDKFIGHLVERNERLKGRIDSIGKEIRSLSLKRVEDELPLLASKAKDVCGVRVLTASYRDIDKDVLRNLRDRAVKVLPSCVMILASVVGGRPVIICAVTDDLVKKGLNASAVVKAAAAVVGGGGGGRPGLAEAGGKDPSKTEEAIEAGVAAVRSALEGK